MAPSAIGQGMEARIADAFGLGRPVGPLTAVESGVMGMVWRLDTDQGAWAAKQMFDWARDDRLEIEARVTDAAVAARLQTPRIVRSQDGRIIVRVDEQRWRVFSWMDLAPPPVRPLSRHQAGALGGLLARLHGLGLPGDAGRVIGWFTRRRPVNEWRGLEAQARAAGPAWAPLLTAALPEIARLVETADPKAFSGACVLSHCDLTEGNVRFGPDGPQLIDWEHAGDIPPAWELGAVLQGWAIGPDGAIDAAAGRAIVEAYRDGGGWAGPLSLDIFAGAISAWLNWTVSRVYTALHARDPVEAERAAAIGQALLQQPVTVGRLRTLLDGVGV
jgi:Ser/Thr protein kinase RdoA (MazF antagonist)